MSDDRGPNRSLPLILIGLGVLVLLFNLGWLRGIFGNLFALLQLWPIALIAVGADLVTKGRYRLIIVVAAIVVGLLLLFVWQRPGSGAGAGAGEAQQVEVALGAARAISLELDTGVADLRLDSAPGGFGALTGSITSGRRENVDVDWRERGDTLEIEVRSRQGRGPFGFLNWGGDLGGGWDLTLAEGVPVDIDIDVGVGDVELDLGRVNLRSVEVDAGVGETTVTLPEAAFEARVDGGVGNITLLLPAGLPVRIDVDSGLGGVDVDDSFVRDGDSYTSANYSGGGARISIDAGVGRVRVDTIR